jgi:hypothetical protein
MLVFANNLSLFVPIPCHPISSQSTRKPERLNIHLTQDRFILSCEYQNRNLLYFARQASTRKSHRPKSQAQRMCIWLAGGLLSCYGKYSRSYNADVQRFELWTSNAVHSAEGVGCLHGSELGVYYGVVRCSAV